MDGCPVGVPIPEFIHHVAEGEFEEAYQTITRENRITCNLWTCLSSRKFNVKVNVLEELKLNQ